MNVLSRVTIGTSFNIDHALYFEVNSKSLSSFESEVVMRYATVHREYEIVFQGTKTECLQAVKHLTTISQYGVQPNATVFDALKSFYATPSTSIKDWEQQQEMLEDSMQEGEEPYTTPEDLGDEINRPGN